MKSDFVRFTPKSLVQVTCCSAVVILVFDLLLLLPLFQGALYFGDILLYFEPMTSFQRSMMLAGKMPLWNPYLLGGQPFQGNPQMWFFSPTTPLLYLVPAWLYLNLISGIALWACGFFCLLFLRRWVRTETSALVGAITYMGSACLVARLQFPPMVLSALFFPALLLLVDRQVDSPHPRHLVWIALVVALAILAAHPQMAYLSLGCAILYAIARLWSVGSLETSQTRPMWLLRRATAMSGALLLGVVLCAVQILPVLQLMRESPREEMTVKEANRFYLEPKQLLTLVAPRYWGHPASGDFRERGNAWEPAIFVGWLPLVLAVLAIRRAHRRRVVQFWLCVGGLAIWLALGMHGGLFVPAFRFIPGLNKFHDPARFLFLTTFGLATLAAIGSDHLQLTRFYRFVSILGVMAPLIWFGWDWNPVVNPAYLAHVPVLQALDSRMPGRVYMPRYRNLWRRYVNYTDYGQNNLRTMSAMLDTMLPNIAVRYKRETVNGYEPVPLSAPLALELLINALMERGEPNATRLLSLLQGNEISQVTEESLYHVRFRFVAHSQGMLLSDNRDALARAWLVHKVRRVEGRERILGALTSPEFLPSRMALVSLGLDSRTSAELSALEWGRGEGKLVQQEASNPNLFTVDAGSEPGLLVTTLAAYPGWNAYLDGEKTRVVRTNGALIGLYVPPGAHRVELRFEPLAYQVGLYISCFALMLWTSLFVALRGEGRGTQTDE